MPFLAGRGQGGRGMFGLGGVPGAPTFANNSTDIVEADQQLVITFIAPAFNGRINHYWL